MINTGTTRMGLPSAGSWVTYGLGSESLSLPAFVAMTDPLGRGLPKGYSQNWSAGFLPSVYQGTWLKPQGDPIDNLYRPADQSAEQQRSALDLLAKLNKHRLEQSPQELELAARIESFELAYRMQMAAPEAIDIDQEPEHIHKLYGVGEKRCDHFARQCLVARRMVERGVRFVQIYSGGMENERSWDGHQNIQANHTQFAGETDTPIAGLLADLKQRGLLQNTLVIWGGEFGRLPIVQKGGTGRDHNPHAFTYWLAGGGIKPGAAYGSTDEIGFKAVENRVHVNDLHATILHLLGLDHQKLTYRYSGRDFRLTDVAGHVVKEILA
jgi:arylsulfatase A-like enzyme